MFIIDLDDVLMDTHSYKEARRAALLPLGVTREIYDQTYQDTYYNYTHENHAKALAKLGFDLVQVKTILDFCLKQVAQFIFPDTIIFLQFLQTLQVPVFLLSFGVTEIQKYKVEALGIRLYFDRIITTIEPKEKVLRDLGPVIQEDSWFIEDKVETAQVVKREFPEFRVVLKQNALLSEADYRASGFPYFKTLKEIKDYVQRNFK